MDADRFNTVRVRYFGLARNAVGREEDEVQLPPHSSVRDLMESLTVRNGEQFRASVLTLDVRLRHSSTILIGDTAVQDLDGLDTRLADGAAVTVMIIVYPTDGG